MPATTISQFGPRAALVAVALIGLATAFALVHGTSLMAVAGIAALVAPLAIYAALRWPLETLFGLYVLLVPFDNLLNTGSFGTLTKLLGIVAGAFLLVWVLRRHLLSLQAPPVRVLALLVIWMLATSFWALDQRAALQAMPTYAGLMLLYAVISMVPITPAQFRLLLTLVVVGGVCAAAYGAHMFYSEPVQQNLAIRRLVVQVGQYNIDPNHFADALIFPAAIAGMWCLRAKSLLTRIACLAPLAVIVFAIFLSGSREAAIGLALIALYYFITSKYRARLGIGLIGLGVLVSTVQSSMFQRFSVALETGGAGRTDIWSVALEAAKHRLLQGYGIGNFPDAYNLFYLHVRQINPFGWDSPAHNLAVHYLVELGVVGLALIGWFFWEQFRSLRQIEKGDELYDYRIVMQASFVAIVAVSLAIDLFQYKYAWLIFSMVALLRSAASRTQQSAAMRPANPAIISSRLARPSSRFFPAAPISRSAALSSDDSLRSSSARA